MIRVVELMLLLAPLAAFIAWRIWAPGKAIPSSAMIGVGAALVLATALLVWLRFEDASPPDAVYIPSHIENGLVVPDRRGP